MEVLLMSSSTCSPRVLLRPRRRESRELANAKKQLERPPTKLPVEVKNAADLDLAEVDAVVVVMVAMAVVVALVAAVVTAQAKASCRWSAASWRRWVARMPACR
jgi:hypothetical protein